MKGKNRIQVSVMAGNNGVTGSCNHIGVKFPDGEKVNFLDDCGRYQGVDLKDIIKYNNVFYFDPAKLLFVIITHDHLDHIGNVPKLFHDGYYGPIYSTRITCKLAKATLNNEFKIDKEERESKHLKKLYNEDDIENTVKNLSEVEYNQTINVHENIKVTFFNSNGHMFGASIILVQISYPGCEDVNLLLTGDYNNKNSFFDVEELPDWVKELPLTIIAESTYGDKNFDKQYVFEKNVVDKIKKQGVVIIPASAIGKVQEVLLKLKKMQQENKIPTNIPIYLDGKLAIDYTKFCIRDGLNIREEYKDFLPENFMYLDKYRREMVLGDKKPKIVVTTSLFCNYGPAKFYICKYIANENALIQASTEFVPKNSILSKIYKTPKGEEIRMFGRKFIKKADVELTNEFTAHAKGDEMLEFLRKFKNIKLILLTHGEGNIKEIFKERIEADEQINCDNVEILNREYCFIITSEGLKKKMPSKIY